MLREVKNSNKDTLEKLPLKKDVEEFKNLITHLVSTKQSKTFYKFSDGEYYFLTDKQIGSVAKGRRDTNKKLDLKPFKDGVLKNDYLCCYDVKRDSNWFKSYFKRDFDYSVDLINVLVASNWFTNSFKVGLIGAYEKLDLIKELCKHKKYIDYIGKPFNDYISVKQRYLCDNILKEDKSIGEQLKNSSSDIYLVGIGHAQTALLHKMKQHKPAIYIVVGSGIDAYAGIQDNDRPYMDNWINYQLKGYDYSSVDIWRDNFKNIYEI